MESSMPQELVAAATLPWVWQTNVNDLTRRLESLLPSPHRAIEWRTDHVTDFRNLTVPQIAERLVRWDYRHPDTVFQDGFLPRAADRTDAAMSLEQYVSTNDPSIFVGTARYYTQGNSRYTYWRPRNLANRFEYEIFAPGGIDVNLSLERSAIPHHSHWNQREIAFPGGILPQFIRSARQYNAAGRVEQVWWNTNFSLWRVGDRPFTTPPVDLIPEFQPRVRQVYWRGPEQHDHHRELRDTSNRYQDIMREAGEPTVDSLMDGIIPGKPPKATFLNPDNPNHAYFFAGTRYALIEIKPKTTDDFIVTSGDIATMWPSLNEARFPSVDAAVSSPNDKSESDGMGETYFFSGDQYALIKVVVPGTTDDKVINGPKPVVGNWPSLQRAGFATVDAILSNPGNKDEAYFFSGDRYALIKIEPGTTNDCLVNKPEKIIDKWPSLKKAGFSTIDIALPSPEGHGVTYFFSGDSYAVIKVIPGTTDDYIVREPRNVADNWPSLRQAQFY